MDIVYLVGPEEISLHHNQELRWSLRSVAKYAKNLGRVIVAGYPPDWLAPEVVRVPVKDDPKDYKFWAIWRKFFAVIDRGVVRGEFLVSCDDHFYTTPVDIDATPFYYRRLGILPFEEMKSGGNGYRRSLAATRDMLVRAGFPARDCAGHQNFRIDTADADEVRRLADAYEGQWKSYGLDIASCFTNVRAMREHITWTFRKDHKVKSLDGDPDAVRCGQFSCDDEAFSDKSFMGYMAREFGSPCRFEEG